MDDLPTEEQLRRIEDRVMTRIRRRAQLPRTIGTTVAIAGLVVGGFALVAPVLHGTGSSSSSGSAGGSGGGGGAAAAAVVRCHSGSAARSRSVAVPLGGAASPGAALDACRKAQEAGRLQQPNDKARATAGAADRFVVCRDPHKTLHVFVKDRAPATLCGRNGMVAP
jgi:hypothetical protein